jgi:cytochrome oxidase assembly protein ShyY1
MIVRDMRTLLSPRMLALHLVAVVVIGAMVVLGLWQLGTYGNRQDVDAAERATQPPVPIDDVLGPDDAFTAAADARRVSVSGEYVDPLLLVDGDADPTPWLVSPLRTGSGSAVLVVRGRSVSPLPAPSGEVTVTGTLLPSQPRETDADPGDGVEPSLSTSRLVAQVGPDLYSGYVVAEQQQPAEDLDPVPPPSAEPSFTAGLRNLMYALQWWVFAGFGVYMWWRIARDSIRR